MTFTLARAADRTGRITDSFTVPDFYTMIPVVISKCCATVGTYAAAPIHWKKNVRYVKEELHCAMEYQYQYRTVKAFGRAVAV